mmetsp:Transcript_1628/g.5427  ORF Transcript_1628/g.5427 Transcript_1628/m.5427 type:complete len:216 (-) Transcript_1628:110-757(-)
MLRRGRGRLDVIPHEISVRIHHPNAMLVRALPAARKNREPAHPVQHVVFVQRPHGSQRPRGTGGAGEPPVFLHAVRCPGRVRPAPQHVPFLVQKPSARPPRGNQPYPMVVHEVLHPARLQHRIHATCAQLAIASLAKREHRPIRDDRGPVCQARRYRGKAQAVLQHLRRRAHQRLERMDVPRTALGYAALATAVDAPRDEGAESNVAKGTTPSAK